MSIDELLRNTNGISVTVSLDDLRQLFSEIARGQEPIAELEERKRTLQRKKKKKKKKKKKMSLDFLRQLFS